MSKRSSSYSASSAHSQPDHDVLVWMEDDHLLEAFKTKNKPLVSASRLNWTMGDISLAAWNLVGPNLAELSGSITRDPHHKKPMHLITMRHYMDERASYAQKMQTRPRQNTAHNSRSSNNKRIVTYIQAVKGTSTK